MGGEKYDIPFTFLSLHEYVSLAGLFGSRGVLKLPKILANGRDDFEIPLL
jgi:hypothetical protein